MNNFKSYPKHKDSGVEWLGEIPEHWNTTPGFSVVSERNEKNSGMARTSVLSLSYGNVIVKPKEKLTGLVPESFETYQFVDPGNIIIRPTDMQNDHTSLRTGLAKDRGIITSAYLNLKVVDGFCERFIHYYLHSIDTNKVIYGLGSGLRQNLDYRDFKRFPFLDIPKTEQITIANFLDDKVGKIDAVIAKKEQLIHLLNERKQITIQNAVTKGLNPEAPMRDSGIEWIGEVPAHWDTLANKHIFKLHKNLVGKKSSEYDLLSLTLRGVVKRDMENPQGKFPAEFDTYQKVKSGDFIFCLFDVEETPRAVGLSKHDGMITGAYTVMRPAPKFHKDFLYYFYLNLDSKKRLKPLYRGLRNTIPKESFFSLKTFIPPIKEQINIVDHIETVSSKIVDSINHANLSITKLKEYKATLINSAVTGKIKVS